MGNLSRAAPVRVGISSVCHLADLQRESQRCSTWQVPNGILKSVAPYRSPVGNLECSTCQISNGNPRNAVFGRLLVRDSQGCSTWSTASKCCGIPGLRGMSRASGALMWGGHPSWGMWLLAVLCFSWSQLGNRSNCGGTLRCGLMCPSHYSSGCDMKPVWRDQEKSALTHEGLYLRGGSGLRGQ
jgi:hypothetical protein